LENKAPDLFGFLFELVSNRGQLRAPQLVPRF
jgi:hypothetical protein